MKKIICILFVLSFAMPLLAATVGGPDLSVPEQSMFLKEKAVKKALDSYNTNIKAAFEAEVVTKTKLSPSEPDTSSGELEGQAYMFKLSNNFFDVFEPYIKLGTSNYDVKWVQHGNDVKVETNPGFAWGMGAKAKIWQNGDYGVKLTLDGQFRTTKLNIDKAKIGGSSATAAATDEYFQINEWQVGLLASKRYIVPLGINDCYIVPYTGMTFTCRNIDVSFTQSSSGLLYSTYIADADNPVGLVFGFDLMPFYLSYYLLNFELRLINETAFTLGGTIKF